MLNTDSRLREILYNPKSLFYYLSPEEVEDFQNYTTFLDFQTEDYIFHEGDKPTGLLILISGKVKILKTGVGGREQIIRMVKPLGVIGYRALFAEENHIGTAVSLEKSLICVIKPEFIFNIALRNSNFAIKIIKKLSKELGFSNNRTVSLTQKHIRGRLAESLLLLKEKYGVENDGTTLKAYLSRDDIANLSNMTTSNTIRTLSTFVEERVIAIDGRKIKILDEKGLDRISKLG